MSWIESRALRLALYSAAVTALSGIILGCATRDESAADREQQPLVYNIGDIVVPDEPTPPPTFSREPQTDGEVPSENRPAISAFLKAFLQQQVFGTGGPTIRLELDPQTDQQRSQGPRVWINPVDVGEFGAYGSDITLITDPFGFDRIALEDVRSYGTTLVGPPIMLQYPMEGGRHRPIEPNQTIRIEGVEITALPNWRTDAQSMHEGQRLCSYLMRFRFTHEGATRTITAFYAGATKPAALWPEAALGNVDILFAPLDRLPSVEMNQVGNVDPVPTGALNRGPLTFNEIRELAVACNADVVVPVGTSSNPTVLRAVAQLEVSLSQHALWIPPAPVPLLQD